VNKLNKLSFSRDQKEIIVEKIKAYFGDQLDHEIGGFEAEFLLEFFANEIGPFFYNQGLADAESLFSVNAQELSYQIQELEKPSDYKA